MISDKSMVNDGDAQRAEMTSAAINDLPDSAFAYIEPGGSKDEQGKTVPRSLRHFPIHDAAHVRNALARAPQSPFGEKAMPKIMAAAKRFGIEMDGAMAGRSRTAAPMPYRRVYPLEGIDILSRAKGGDGRTVEAYAAVFNVPKEIHDQHGDYVEVNDPRAFARTINSGAAMRAQVLYNHGFDARGKSGGLPTVPIGHPKEIRADARGLLTVSRYNDSEFTDMVLASIRNGDIKAQSYEGTIYRSDPARAPGRAKPGSPLPRITRLEMGLKNYGPTPTAYYEEAEIVAVRSVSDLAEDFARLDPEQRDELIRTLSTTPGWDPETAAILATPHRGPGAEDSRTAHSIRQKKIRLRAELLARSL